MAVTSTDEFNKPPIREAWLQEKARAPPQGNYKIRLFTRVEDEKRGKGGEASNGTHMVMGIAMVMSGCEDARGARESTQRATTVLQMLDWTLSTWSGSLLFSASTHVGAVSVFYASDSTLRKVATVGLNLVGWAGHAARGHEGAGDQVHKENKSGAQRVLQDGIIRSPLGLQQRGREPGEPKRPKERVREDKRE
ncbi:uncharacterized protein Z519_06536 [Cladophialophora bantiana CBS 173.52]|uniref:Uncharacterized protein n=1 Tax=Cladophialophora bantiana (strain ATCC 10958 / CBS 173.52 / CDC B-1940 / NIH 8579) TaxID=1442370 RepID=A0A0D2I771_CLAB1|nr:uncharacterized protein Z519_06536 [Cladophialophora bantiana CBS 173.52]KIW92689.1 hypothetical protein Z519_06536 [Cladophialophora bantiana CBS 173.52]